MKLQQNWDINMKLILLFFFIIVSCVKPDKVEEMRMCEVNIDDFINNNKELFYSSFVDTTNNYPIINRQIDSLQVKYGYELVRNDLKHKKKLSFARNATEFVLYIESINCGNCSGGIRPSRNYMIIPSPKNLTTCEISENYSKGLVID